MTIDDLADEAHIPVEIVRTYIQSPGTPRRVPVE